MHHDLAAKLVARDGELAGERRPGAVQERFHFLIGRLGGCLAHREREHVYIHAGVELAAGRDDQLQRGELRRVRRPTHGHSSSAAAEQQPSRQTAPRSVAHSARSGFGKQLLDLVVAQRAAANGERLDATLNARW